MSERQIKNLVRRRLDRAQTVLGRGFRSEMSPKMRRDSQIYYKGQRQALQDVMTKIEAIEEGEYGRARERGSFE